MLHAIRRHQASSVRRSAKDALIAFGLRKSLRPLQSEYQTAVHDIDVMAGAEQNRRASHGRMSAVALAAQASTGTHWASEEGEVGNIRNAPFSPDLHLSSTAKSQFNHQFTSYTISSPRFLANPRADMSTTCPKPSRTSRHFSLVVLSCLGATSAGIGGLDVNLWNLLPSEILATEKAKVRV